MPLDRVVLASAAGGRRQRSGQPVLRHDIDTDVATATKLFVIEREMGVKASYYFRLSTVDLDFMQELNASGREASYHFEEIATVAKERRLRTRDQVLAHLPEIQERFLSNLTALRRNTGLPMHVVAAHGDFVNRRLGMPNEELFDERVRKEAAIDLEVYDPAFMDNLSSYFSNLLPGLLEALRPPRGPRARRPRRVYPDPPAALGREPSGEPGRQRAQGVGGAAVQLRGGVDRAHGSAATVSRGYVSRYRRRMRTT